MTPPPATTYEVWVRTLRAWSKDSRVSLTTLPPLTDDSFPRAAFDRLIKHINDALESVGEEWVSALSRTVSSIGDPATLAADLVSLRPKLARRLELARHPSLPPGLRAAFSEEVERSIYRSQAQLEEAISGLGRSGSTPAPRVEQLHHVVRANSFVAVLNYVASEPGGRLAPELRLVEPPRKLPAPTRSHRRIMP